MDYSEQKDSLSRRNFLTGAGIAAGAVLVSSVIPAQAFAVESTATASTATATPQIFDGVKLSIGHVVHDPKICAGCRTCEIVCAVKHEGIASSELSRIQWTKGIMDACITDIMTCKQCPGPECVAVCPTKALHVDADTGARVIDEKLCTGCQLCLNACPVVPTRIRYNAAKNVCFKCDLCGGNPQCVKFCPTGALTSSWVEADTSADENNIFEVNLTGDTKTFAHVETNTLKLEQAGTGLSLAGVVWTSHATQFNIILAKFDVTADFYDKSGNKLGSSDNSVHIEIPEMSSGEFALTWTTSSKVADIGKVVVNVPGEYVTNAPGQEG